MPAGHNPATQFQPHPWIVRNIAHVSRSHPVFGNKPELRTDTPVADRSAPRPGGLAAGRLKERMAWRHNADCKQDLDLRIQEILLQEVNNAVFHAPHLHRF